MILPTFIEAQSADEFLRRGTELLAEGIRQAVAARGTCVLGLSGGSTPRAIYAQVGLAAGIEWKNVWIFLVDERCVAPTADEANARLVADTFGALPESHQIAPDTSLDPDACAKDYDAKLQALFAAHGNPDLVTLGMGDDGHIASLFPPLSEKAFGPEVAIHTVTDRFAVRDRISVTLPLLHKTPNALFFLKGEAKRKVWQEMMQGGDAKRWPARHVMEFGQTTVLLQP